MNTTDQTFIRAYGSDFVPNYADEAARAADYPALADSNVNAVFGSMPQKHIRVDGPAAMPPSATSQVAGVGPSPPLPARTYMPQAATQPTSPAAQGQHTPPQHPHVPPAIGQQLEHPVQREQAVEQQVDVPLPHLDMRDNALPPGSVPIASHAPVPRPHINFAPAQSVQPQPTDVETSVEPAIEQPLAPSPAYATNALELGEGLSVLADSSVLVASSDFQWPTIHPAVDEEPTDTENPPLGSSIANIDKDVAGVAMDAKAEEPDVAKQKLKPAWEVDRFLWPSNVDQLYESESEYFRHAGEKLHDASLEGLRVLGVSATRQGEGCTTLAICLARAAAAAGAKVALLDANLRAPQLGTALGLDFARSWHETLNGKTPLSEAAVASIADNVTLIPLSNNAARQGLTLDSDAINDILGQAGDTFDLVLVDVGVPCEDGRSCFQGDDACPLDAAIIVRDVRATSEEETLESVNRYKELGIDAVGIAENFASLAVSRAAV
ncbi:MAG: hypothetical protein QGH33_15005 [Pirellulaceae bacterium]|jgi:Mrp family chromosome partitioning ATPase|nr:hypothetical protein [Pirellulaceae bacterium]HJN07296.1 hypothetical protein [Pirellulaceae bacterium]